MSLGLLILRVVVGLLIAGHGTQKLLGWFGGSGPAGTERNLDSLGYRPARVMARVSGLTETLGGLCLALGFLTPLAAAAIIGQMLNAALAVHAKNGLWNTKGGFELPLTNATVAAALAFTGPGAFSVDRAMGFVPDHVLSGLFALLLGIVVGLIVFAARTPEVAREAGTAASDRRRRAA